MKYRHKPTVVEAFRYNIDPRPNWFTDRVCNLEIITYELFCSIETMHGFARANKGDYIVRGIKGEYYPVSKEVFEESYERVE